MPPVGFEPTTPAGERPQTYALDRATTGTGVQSMNVHLVASLRTDEVSTTLQLFKKFPPVIWTEGSQP